MNGASVYIPRGRALGGSSSINGMVYIRGHRSDYDDWKAAGNTGWGWDDVLPYFIKAEGKRGVPRFGSARQRRPPQRHLLSSRRSSYFRPSTTPLRISWIGSVSSCPAFDAKRGTYSELSRPARRRGSFSNDFARKKRRLDDSSSRSRTSAPPGTSPRSTCTASGGYSKITSVASAIGCAVTLWLLGRRYPSSSSSRTMRAVRGP
jgi:choline dehydrogenase-like flavoprotein